MNPLALLFGLMAIGGVAGGLGGGRNRGRQTRDDEDESEGTGSGGEQTDGKPVTDPTGPGTDTPSPPPVNLNPEPPVQTGGTGTSGGEVAPTPVTSAPVDVISGRVTTLEPEGDNIASVRIVNGPAHGHVSVNPDNTLALVMTLDKDYAGDLGFTYEVTHKDGSTTLRAADLNVLKGPQDGWATSETHYMLETDANGNVLVEHGDVHRKVYVSGSDKALSRADIAALEKIDVNQITGAWLAQNPEYGGSEGLALDREAGELLWNSVSGRFSDTSNWLLLERGHEYNWGTNLVNNAASGESELHPLFIGAWGEGTKPVITSNQMIFHSPSENVVFQGLEFTAGVSVLTGENVLFDDVTLTGKNIIMRDSSGITFRNSDLIDVYWEEAPAGTGDTWTFGSPRTTGLLATNVDGLLLEGLYFDQIGWAPDYRYDMSTEGGQPPNYFSHGMYIQRNSSDVTLRDSIIMRGASTGVQFRAGGYVEDNVFLDNNIGITIGFGDSMADGTNSGQYTLFTDNIVTSGAHLTVKEGIGFKTLGIDQQGHLISLVDTIVAHLANPDDPTELTEKTVTDSGLKSVTEPFYDDTIIWNWQGAVTRRHIEGWRDQNVDGLDTAVLDKTTIQQFTALLLGKPDATIDDLSAYLRAQAHGAFDDVVDSDLIVRFFQQGFGIAPDIRTEAGLLRFIPHELGDGVRWDNRLNWSTNDLPGFASNDGVDLGGNKVIYGGTATVGQLEFGQNGGLMLDHGKLTVARGTETDTGATLDVNGAGQFWTEGARGTDLLDIDVTGGRFANTGAFKADATLTASGGQTLLGVDGATYAVTDGSRLEVVGGAGKVGFDGENGGISILGLADGGTLAFKAEDGELGTIEEFRSGALGETANVRSGADLGRGKLEIDLTELAGGTEFTLLDVDELIGAFGSVNVTGLSGQDAKVIIDYETDAVRLELTAGTGKVNTALVGTAGQVTTGDEALMKALTDGQGTYDDAAVAQDDEDYLFAA